MPAKFPVQRVRRSGSAVLAVAPSNNALSLSDVQDMIYIANITLGGVSFPVQLDTGSSDVWVMPTSGPLPNANYTSTSLNLTYGIGWANGQVALASANFAGVSVSQQAYLNVTSAQNPCLTYGASGIVGLGFDSLSTIDLAFNHTGSSSGRSLLYNLFHDNPSEPNFITFSLTGGSDNDGIQGSFTVGETDPSYSNVTSMNKIPTWPVTSPLRWSVLLDSFIVGTQTHTLSTTVPAAPHDKAVVVLDSGTSYTYAPTNVCETIYGGVSGAQYNTALGQWIVPCDAEIDMALQIDNQIFAIHPLDIAPVSQGDPSTCFGSIIPQNVEPGQFDWLIGDNILRSIYTLYDYGDFNLAGDMGDPYVQMLSLIDPVQASVEFHNVRGGTPNTNITYNVSNVGDSGSGSTSVNLSSDAASALENLSNFFPVLLGIMALNAVALIALVVVGITLLCKRRAKNARARKSPGRLSPMPVGDTSAIMLPERSPGAPHSYQPVSMAMTEDTLFAPPSPSFKTEPSARFGRPSSIA